MSSPAAIAPSLQPRRWISVKSHMCRDPFGRRPSGARTCRQCLHRNRFREDFNDEWEPCEHIGFPTAPRPRSRYTDPSPLARFVMRPKRCRPSLRRRQNNQMVPLFQLPHAQAWSTPVIGGDGELQPGCRRDRLPPLHFGWLCEAIREPTDDHDPRSILIITIWSDLTNGRYHMEQLLLSPQEAAQSLGISRSRLYELIRKQELVS